MTAVAPNLPAAQTSPAAPAEVLAELSFSKVTEELTKASKRLRIVGYILIGAGMLGGLAAAIVISLHTEEAVTELEQNPDNYILGLFLIIRAAAYAAFLTGLVFALVRLGQAFLDQSTRYEKRLMASHFMNSVMERYKDKLAESDINLGNVVAFLDAWSSTVESAFTRVKLSTKASAAATSFSVNKEGISFDQGAGAAGGKEKEKD